MRVLTTLLLLVGLFVGSALPALAVPTLTISSSGNGAFVLQGTDFKTVGGVQLTIRYDTATLANPRVTKGALGTAAAIFIPNTNTPGVIIMGMIDPNGVSGSGVLATINFDMPGSSPGVIQSLTADVIDSSSKKIASQVQVINPTGTSPSAGSQASPTSTSDATPVVPGAPGTPATPRPVTSGSGPAAALTVGTPGTTLPEADKPREQAVLEPPPAPPVPAGDRVLQSDTAGETARLSPPATTKSKPVNVAYKSILEQFRTLTGEKTPQTLTEIFTRHSVPGVRQEPAIGLADGVSKVRLTVTPQGQARTAPNFSLQNARLVSLKMEDDRSWLIELLPAKGVNTASLTMLQDGSETEIPLTVVAPLLVTSGFGRNGVLSEDEFRTFLAERGTEQAPRFDLNGDGRRDYQDDYIFTANYLLRKGK